MVRCWRGPMSCPRGVFDGAGAGVVPGERVIRRRKDVVTVSVLTEDLDVVGLNLHRLFVVENDF